MKLNLHIIKEDLSDLKLEGILPEDCYRRPLRFAARYNSEYQLWGDRLYIMMADELTEALGYATGKANIICVGIPNPLPPEAAKHNVLWTSQPVDINQLTERVNEIFARYNDWIDAVEKTFSQNKPLRRAAELSEDIFDNPIWMWDSFMQTVFFVITPDNYTLPERYQYYVEESPWPANGVNHINDEFREARNNTDPYVLPPMFGYNSLCYNIFENNIYAATLTVDGINGNEFTCRDKALIKVLGDRIAPRLKYEAHFSKHATYKVNKTLESLLAREAIPALELSTALSSMGWSVDDTYFCIVAHQYRSTNYPESLLIPAAEKACDAVSKTIFTLDNGDIVFVSNISLTTKSLYEICGPIIAQLNSAGIKMQLGISTPFSDLANLVYFRDQALEAIQLGQEFSRIERSYDEALPAKEMFNFDGEVYVFEDYILEAIIERCTKGTIPETLFPPELSRIIGYDIAHNSDLTTVLRAYLENNMSTKETAQALSMHRNTLLSRLKKIEDIGKMNLEDFDTRLMLGIAFALYDNQSKCDEA